MTYILPELEKAIELYRSERVWESHVLIQNIIRKCGFKSIIKLNPICSEIQRRAAIIKHFIDSLNEFNIKEISISSEFYNKKYEDIIDSIFYESDILLNNINIDTRDEEEFFSDNNSESNLSFKSLNNNGEIEKFDEEDIYFDECGNLLENIKIEDCQSLVTNTNPREWVYIIKKDPFDLWYRSYENSSIIEICFQGNIATNILNVLSVFYERDLYKNWIPYYSFPMKFGLNSIKEIMHRDRVHIVTAIYIDIPWPFSNREVILEIWASDEILPNNRIFIHASSIEDHGFHPRLKVNIPYSMGYSNRANISGGGLISPENDELTHIIFKWKIDLLFEPPKFLLNFFLKIFIKACWDKFCHVCLQVDKPNSLHKERLNTNKELYDFIKSRINTKNIADSGKVKS